MLFIHYRTIEELDGAQGIQDLPILKKLATYLHNNDVFPDRFSKASALLFGIAKKKPFLDLNKESALLLTKIFLSLNGENLNIEGSALTDFIKKELSKATVEEIKKVIIHNSTASI